MPETQKTVFVLHTSLALVDVLGKLFKEIVPGVRIVNLVDDSLLADVRAAGHVTPSVTRRMLGYGQLAASTGASAIFNACSSVGEVADMLRQTIDIPVIKIDESMADEAVSLGRRIAVIATVPTTLEPTVKLIESRARLAGREVEITPYLAEGAFDALAGGNPQRHDELVADAIRRAAAVSDVVTLAQGSMARLVPQLAPELQVPLLSSPERGIRQLAAALQ